MMRHDLDSPLLPLPLLIRDIYLSLDERGRYPQPDARIPFKSLNKVLACVSSVFRLSILQTMTSEARCKTL